MPFITPLQSPGSRDVMRAIVLPADGDYWRLVAGALLELADVENYEQPDGHQTAENTANFFLEVLSDFYDSTS